jgi:hypothetical protein
VIATGIQERNGKLEENLRLLRSLAQELERAMQAIARNSLEDLEDSIANQQSLSAQLVELRGDVAGLLKKNTPSPIEIDEDLMQQVRAASSTLQLLNRRYSALLHHSSRSVEMMVSLFSSFRGQIQEDSGPGLKYQTWSCQV